MALREVPVVWLQAGGCSGCTVSLANSAFPSLRNLLLDTLLPATSAQWGGAGKQR